ncbi:hypothetical protein [Actinoplanes sp. NPDC051851]|uniref:hypothetical protein n=1 Tax=Actinoplanes sp. NPDC051851 TaxID=3154753 RepID=UPI00341D9F1F
MTGTEIAALFGGGLVAGAVLAPATMIGGFASARIARRMPSRVLRWTIVVFATAVAVAPRPT